jgi:hypothetical protein
MITLVNPYDKPGAYNPHNVQLWIIALSAGPYDCRPDLYAAWASCLQDAIDEVSDWFESEPSENFNGYPWRSEESQVELMFEHAEECDDERCQAWHGRFETSAHVDHVPELCDAAFEAATTDATPVGGYGRYWNSDEWSYLGDFSLPGDKAKVIEVARRFDR